MNGSAPLSRSDSHGPLRVIGSEQVDAVVERDIADLNERMGQGWPQTTGGVLKLTKLDSALTLLAYSAGDLVGCVIARISTFGEEEGDRPRAEFLYVHHMVVHPQHQHKGLGTRLFSALVDLALTGRIGFILLHTSAQKGNAAVGFYDGLETRLPSITRTRVILEDSRCKPGAQDFRYEFSIENSG